MIGTYLRVSILNMLPKYILKTVHVRVITLYGILKSGVGSRIKRDSVYRFDPFGKRITALLQIKMKKKMTCILPDIESMSCIRMMFCDFNKCKIEIKG